MPIVVYCLATRSTHGRRSRLISAEGVVLHTLTKILPTNPSEPTSVTATRSVSMTRHIMPLRGSSGEFGTHISMNKASATARTTVPRPTAPTKNEDPFIKRSADGHPRELDKPPGPLPEEGNCDVATLLVDATQGPESSEATLVIGHGITIGESIGEGGMARVRSGEQQSLRRQVAVKTVYAPEQRESLLREAYVTAAVDHPNIVPIHDLVFDHDGTPMMVLKRIEGESWLDAMKNPEVELRRWTRPRRKERSNRDSRVTCALPRTRPRHRPSRC